MRLTIAGTGAMGCLFGAKLAPLADVTLLGTWPEGVAAVRAGGVRLVEDGRELVVPVRATRDPAECAGTELALVLVKAWQTGRAARQLAACLIPGGVALTLQNGLGNLEQMQAALGPERAALGITAQGATLLGPGWVRAGGAGPTTVGEHPRVGAAVALLREAGFEARVAGQVESLVWGKLAINAGINPLTALLRVPNGALLESPERVELMEAAARVREVARGTAANRSSMLQDVERNRPTEIDAISGAIAREAAALGVPAPVNAVLWKLVRALPHHEEEHGR